VADNQGQYTLVVAAFADPDAAGQALDALEEFDKAGTIDVVAATVASRDADGKVSLREVGVHTTGVGATAGVLVGGLLGLIFPPTLLAGAIVGGATGGVIGKLKHRHDRSEMKEQIEETLPPGTSGVVAVVENTFLEQLDRTLAAAEKISKQSMDAATVKDLEQESAAATESSA
jgi:uncharacterized membrane protein